MPFDDAHRIMDRAVGTRMRDGPWFTVRPVLGRWNSRERWLATVIYPQVGYNTEWWWGMARDSRLGLEGAS